ncbi:ribosome recycling factor [Flavobacteriales bacterium]|nr:ribosome recycling factor [Flavobacteriales bacterium]
MTEEIQMGIDEAKDQMNQALSHLNSELTKIRAGKANPSMLDSVSVDYYGSMTPLSQVANVSTIDARTITVQPWEKAMLDEIARGIINSNLGLNPQNNGEIIIINVPMLTEERRRDLVKRAKSEGEHAKVSIRNQRKEANDFIKTLKDSGLSEDMAKRAEDEVQKVVDVYSKKVDDLIDAKEKDIMTV